MVSFLTSSPQTKNLTLDCASQQPNQVRLETTSRNGIDSAGCGVCHERKLGSVRSVASGSCAAGGDAAWTFRKHCQLKIEMLSSCAPESTHIDSILTDAQNECCARRIYLSKPV